MEAWRRISHCDCDSGRTTKPQQSGHFLPLGSPPGPPQWSTATTRPQNVGMATRGFHRRGSAFTIAGWRFPFDGLVEVFSEHDRTELEARVPDEQQQRYAHRTSFSAFVVGVDVRGSKVGARLVGCLAKFAGNCQTFNSPCRVAQRTWNLKRCTRDVALEGVFLLEEYGTVVLGDHVEVLLQETVGDEAGPLLYANRMPWAVEVRSKQTRIRSTCWSWVPRRDLQLVGRARVGLVGPQGRARRPAGQTVQELRGRLTICKKVRNESVAPARQAGLLDAPSIHPITVILAI